MGFTPLNPSNNLSDVVNAATARSNLGLGPLSILNPTCTANQVLKYDGSSWICAADSDTTTIASSNITGAVAIANGGTGATSASAARENLGIPNCATDQIIKWDATLNAGAGGWKCAADGNTSRGSSTAWVHIM